VTLCAGEFVPPAEGPIAFRLDKIPLDKEVIEGLAMQLETLARGIKAEKAADYRGVAQMLALAMALDPGNQKVRELLETWLQGRPRANTDDARAGNVRQRISQYVAWLETPEAGRHGQALAACLKDILIISDPQHPEAEEAGAWAGWIPELSAYESQAVAKNGNTDQPRPRVVAPDGKNEILLSKSQVHTLLWRKVGKDESSYWALAAAPLQMSAIKVGDDNGWNTPPLAIVIGPGPGVLGSGALGSGVPGSGVPGSATLGSGQDGGQFVQTSAMLCNLLRKQHESLPQGWRITITSKELEQSIQSRKRQSLSAAAAVLASSAITGREPEAIIIGQIDEAGAFKLPTAFWDQLMALGKGSGQRLVLPADAKASLPSLLAMERPGFFLEYEVLLAANFQQLLDLTAKTPDDPLAKTSAQFRKIRETVGSQDVRQYIANRFVRQRLGEILQETPAHFSAKMLLVQASGNRPTLVSRAVLAAELRRALDPLDWLVKTAESISAPWSANAGNDPPNRPAGSEFSTAEIARIALKLDLCRSRIDGLERFVDKNDRELLGRTRKIIGAIRNLDKAIRVRGTTDTMGAAVRAACADFLGVRKQLGVLLAHEAGDPSP
jgi:hypothetical protein